ncbi:hypothetical protein VNO77_46270 [Canavalia gladiata]|uniref:Uncharacterized protein n=1 Tax=Canavalia gladiata TaxID=3824 RepID=A0AAN9JJQ0_CANGL
MGEEKQYKGILGLTPTAKHILEQGMDGSFNIVCASPSGSLRPSPITVLVQRIVSSLHCLTCFKLCLLLRKLGEWNYPALKRPKEKKEIARGHKASYQLIVLQNSLFFCISSYEERKSRETSAAGFKETAGKKPAKTKLACLLAERRDSKRTAECRRELRLDGRGIPIADSFHHMVFLNTFISFPARSNDERVLRK